MKQTAVLRWTRLDFNGFAGVMNKLGQQSMQFVIPALAIMVFLLVWAETARGSNSISSTTINMKGSRWYRNTYTKKVYGYIYGNL